jgi:3'-5' exoribonuclease
MKPYFIKDLRPDEGHHIEDRYLVRNAEIRDGNNGKKHLYMTLGDATGDIQSVKWSLTPDEVTAYSKIEPGMVIRVTGRCKDYRGQNQLIIDNIKGRAPEGSYERADLYKAAPEEPQAMYDYIVGRINDFKDEELDDLASIF